MKFAQEVANILSERNDKVIFAESCTAGMLSASLAGISGISNNLCGSAVTYRPKLKRSWLGVRRKTIMKFTTESPQVAKEMAIGALLYCPEANWSVSVVGHMGPNAPKEKDGLVFFCFARRTKKGKIKIKKSHVYKCHSKERVKRLEETTEAAMTHFARILNDKRENAKEVSL